MHLRPYQQKLKYDINHCWANGLKNVLAVSPTGSGKTVIFSDVLKDHDAPSVAIAHRQELVTQISIALARDGVKHKIIGPKSVIRTAINLHMDELGKDYHAPNAHCAVAGVDTIIRRKNELSRWSHQVTKWIQDEAHHLLTSNKWGSAVSMFPNAVGLGVTATPTRTDGKGLGRWASGLFDCMVEGPTMRELINDGFLTDYRIFAPPSDLDLTQVKIGESGEYTGKSLKQAVDKSHIVGDVVSHYLKIALGKLGITFVSDVATATRVAKEFNERGVSAAVVTADTSDYDRIAILKKFKARKILQLVNVDLFGEGFDLPAVEVVSMARPTQSFALYVQQFGRALRLMDGKKFAIIIDHVNNVIRHGLPDAFTEWTLDSRERKVKKETDQLSLTTCPECSGVYERVKVTCPYCGYYPMPSFRSSPKFVDGNLYELDVETLRALRGEVARIDMSPEEYRAELIAKHAPRIGVNAGVKRHIERQSMQAALRESIAWWAGYMRQDGVSDAESYKRFYLTFGIDVLSAQALNYKDAESLANKINYQLGAMHYAQTNFNPRRS